MGSDRTSSGSDSPYRTPAEIAAYMTSYEVEKVEAIALSKARTAVFERIARDAGEASIGDLSSLTYMLYLLGPAEGDDPDAVKRVGEEMRDV